MTTSGTYRRAQRALAPNDVVLTALEIRHPDVAEPVRIVNDSRDQVIGGARFVALRFTITLVDDEDGAVPAARITVDNVGAPLTQWVERAGGGAGATARVLQALPGAAEPEWDVTLEVVSMRVTADTVEATLGYEPLLQRRAVRLRFDSNTSPGLF